VAAKGTESRLLNRTYATADPRPVPQQEFSFQGESFDGGPHRHGRPSGQRPTKAEYCWNMTDGFIY
jgi:hypothetical protein